MLTLRLRDRDRESALAAPDRLRVVRKNPESRRGAIQDEATIGLEIVDFEDGKGVAFPIRRFGTYVVAIERDR